MKNIALIFAGGVGSRMNHASLPKQFIKLYGKPIIIYTIEHFEWHKDIDEIIVVCKSDLKEQFKKFLNEFNIKKVTHIINGGETGILSIYNGLKLINEKYDENTIVLINDGVRPLIDARLISQCIKSVKEKGNAISAALATETIALKTSQSEVGKVLNRSDCQMIKAPQCFYIKEVFAAYTKIIKSDKADDFIDSASIMQYCGHKLNIVSTSLKNIKITTPIDFYVFKAFYDNEGLD